MIQDLLFIYAICAALYHTCKAMRWASHKLVDAERLEVLQHHVWHHKDSIKECKQDNCSKLMIQT